MSKSGRAQPLSFVALRDFGSTPTGISILFVALAITGWWWWSYSGPYRWLAELQISLLSGYEAVITGLVILVAVLYVLLLIGFVVLRWCNLESMTIRANDLADDDSPFRSREVLVMGSIMAAGLVVFGIMLFNYAARGTTLTAISIEDLEQGVSPNSTWIQIQNATLLDEMIETDEGNATFRYAPIVSESWTSGAPIVAIARFSRSRFGSETSGPILGAVRIEGVPGFVRTFMAGRNLHVHDEAIVVKIGERPGEFHVLAIVVMACGVVLGIVLLVFYLVNRTRDEGDGAETKQTVDV